MNSIYKGLLALFFAVTFVAVSFGQVLTPQGRLTLQSNTPVMTTDITGATTTYYAPYVGSYIPLWNGTGWANYQFSQLTCALNASWQASGQMFDAYVFLNGSTPTLGLYDQGWTNTSGTRYAPSQFQGIWTLYNQLYGTYENGSTAYNLSSHINATYVGTIYMTASGATSMQLKPTPAAGGTNNVLGIYNAYNRVPVTAMSMDSTLSWTYNINSARPADNSTSNRINFIDGLGQSNVVASYSVAMGNSTTGNAIVGIGLDTSTSITVPWAQTGGNFLLNPVATITAYPLTGFHYVQAMEQVFSGTETFDGSGAYQALTLNLSM